MEEKKKGTEGLRHQIAMTNRNLLEVEGVINLITYDQEQIILETSSGVLDVKGDKLHVQQLNLDQGKIMIDGEMVSLVYSDQDYTKKSKSFFGRLIK